MSVGVHGDRYAESLANRCHTFSLVQRDSAGAFWQAGRMATTRHSQIETDDVLFLTPDEEWRVFDSQARRLLDMSGEEFLRRWNAGEFDAIADTAAHPHIMVVALIPHDCASS